MGFLSHILSILFYFSIFSLNYRIESLLNVKFFWIRISKFQKEIPALDKVQQEVKFSVAKTKGVQLPDGRTVPVRSEHAALNTLLQGSGAIVSKLWMCIAYVNLKKKFGNQVYQVAYVHDELQYSCSKTIADEVGKVVTLAATEAGEKLGLKIRIDANYSIGSNWSETH